MASMFKNILNLLIGTEPVGHSAEVAQVLAAPPVSSRKAQLGALRPFRKLTERELIQLESDIGAKLFGAVPAGHRREFFNLDLSTWIWYDEWNDPTTGTRGSTTIRYEVHKNGILKVQEGARYSFIDGRELENFMSAIHLYYERVARDVYQAEPRHQHPLRAHPVA